MQKKLECSIEYVSYIDNHLQKYISINSLYVDPLLRKNGIGRLLLQSAIDDIRRKYKDIPILIIVKPYGEIGMSKEELITFYKKFDLKIVNEWPYSKYLELDEEKVEVIK